MSRTREVPMFQRVATCLLLSAPLVAQVPQARQVAAPPEDILDGIVVLPDPGDVAVRSRSALVLIDFEAAGGEWRFERTLELNAGEPLTLFPFGTHREEWAVALRAPGGVWVDVEQLVSAGRATRVASSGGGAADLHPAEGIVLEPAAVPVGGSWGLRITAPRTRGDRAPAGRVLLSGIGPLRLVSHLTTHRLLADGGIGIVAHLVDPRGSDEPLLGVVETARVVLEHAFGRIELAMHDDGRHADGAPGDGRYGALLPAGISGDVRALATLTGLSSDGQAVRLTGQHAFPILQPTVFLAGEVRTRSVEDRYLELGIGIVQLPVHVPKLHVSAEVWARTRGEEPVPVAWLSKMAVPSIVAKDSHVVTMSLDGRWLGRVGQGAPFEGLELRRLRIQDPDTHVVLDSIERLPFEARHLPATAFGSGTAVTQDMLMGPPASAPGGAALPRGLRGALMLVHGYCSGGNIWPPADFDEPKVVFLDPDENRTHDEFAQLLIARGVGLPSFGVLGHSQGGAAALHLYTYYLSGLDRARGPRRIQSVATPYQGTPLASFGGFACGVNNDLTVSGAATWLSGIPTWAREEVYYWTTVDNGPACEPFANLILDFDDNDGTTERVRGQLPGATNMGHIPGWCHTTGMSFPASYTDSTLNADRNASAAR